MEIIRSNKSKEQREELFDSIMNQIKNNKHRALTEIPVDLLDIDEEYQTVHRTSRSLTKLIDNWNENKLEPITVVPHPEESKFIIVNGFGRWQASQRLNKPYKYLTAIVLLGSPKDIKKRKAFEAELFAYQDREASKISPLQLHGAKLILKVDEAVLLEKMKNKYNFSYNAEGGNKEGGVLGSYAETLNLAKKGQDCFEYVFDILNDAGYDRQKNGYATYMLRALRDMWELYPEFRRDTKVYLWNYLRQLTPSQIKASAVSKYPLLDHRTALSLFVEDELVEALNFLPLLFVV